jgi:hypothetical protein
LRVQTDDGRLDEKRIGEKFLIALRSHDWELMRTILAPDRSLPGSSPNFWGITWSRRCHCSCQLIASYGLNFGLKHVLYVQFCFALSLNNTAQRGNLALDEHLATVCSLREEKISRIDTYLSDVPMANVFFA